MGQTLSKQLYKLYNRLASHPIASFYRNWDKLRSDGPCTWLVWKLRSSPRDFVGRSRDLEGVFNRGFTRQSFLHGRNNDNQGFALERTFFPIGNKIYCSCHATWLPCKTYLYLCPHSIIPVSLKFRVLPGGWGYERLLAPNYSDFC